MVMMDASRPLVFLTAFVALLTGVLAQRLGCSNSENWLGVRTTTDDKVSDLRNAMLRYATTRGITVEAFIITPYDEHQTEFVDEWDQRIKYMTGYRGPGGIAVVTKTKAALWIAPAYYWLADQEIDCDWLIFNEGDPKNATVTEWLRKELRSGVRIGADPKLVPASLWDEWRRELEAYHIALNDVSNFVDEIRTLRSPVESHPKNLTSILSLDGQMGEKRAKKIEMLRANLTRFDCDAMIVTALDEIAWLLNVRTSDSGYHPFVKSYLFVTQQEVHWYLPAEKQTLPVRKQFQGDHQLRIRLRNYDDIWKDLRVNIQSWRRILIPTQCEFSMGASQAVASQIPTIKRVFRPSPIIFFKARKNAEELKGMRDANIRDSAVFVDFMAWLDEQMLSIQQNVTESDIYEKLDELVANQTYYKGHAFPWMIAYGYHSYLQGYVVSNVTDTLIDSKNVLVVHTGSHYLNGTSSVARTFHFGSPTREQIEAYTLTLSGDKTIRLTTIFQLDLNISIHIISLITMIFPHEHQDFFFLNEIMVVCGIVSYALKEKYNNFKLKNRYQWTSFSQIADGTDSQMFPETTRTSELDVIARAPLWTSGMSPDLPIGHGIGCFSTVHESPVSIEYNSKKPKQVLQDGYTLTIGPRYVLPKTFGIHIENTMQVLKKRQGYLGFEPLTLVPYEESLIDPSLLSEREIDTINRYHTHVLQTVGPELKRQSRMNGFYWLMRKTKAINPHCNLSMNNIRINPSSGLVLSALVYMISLRYFL